MTEAEPIKIQVDPTNPGQFFACCGVLDLVDRISGEADGWFEGPAFFVRSRSEVAVTATQLLDELARSTVTNAMTAREWEELSELSAMSASARAKAPGLDERKKSLEKLRREGAILLHKPFNLRIDWFHDTRTGGSRFKTWAGQQSVFDIASSMKKAIEAPAWRSTPPEEWFSRASVGCGLPFNFDSDLGGQGSALDIGFSFDPLAGSAATRIESSARPFLELLAFIGLQRFRPRQVTGENRFLYCLWNRPLPPEVAAPAACEALPQPGAPIFEFRLLYRTKYLKSFLPAIPFSGGSDE